jgi:hypothetical protein
MGIAVGNNRGDWCVGIRDGRWRSERSWHSFFHQQPQAPGPLLLRRLCPFPCAGLQSDLFPQAACLAALPFLQFALGVLLPSALSAYYWHPDEHVHETAIASAPADSSSHAGPAAAPGVPGQPRRSLVPAAAAPAWARASHLARNARGVADRSLRAALCTGGGRWARAAVCWWLLALCWALCRTLPSGQM